MSDLKKLERLDFLLLALIPLWWGVFLVFKKTQLSLLGVDDAFIFLRLLDNLLDGQGWAFNPGQNVNPITAPFYIIFMLPFRLLPMSEAMVIGSAYLVGVALLGVGVYLGMKCNGRLIAIICAISSVSGGVLVYSWGMETSLFLAVVVLAALAHDRKCYATMGCCAE